MIPFGNFAIDVKCVHKQYRLCLLQLPCFYEVLLLCYGNLRIQTQSFFLRNDEQKIYTFLAFAQSVFVVVQCSTSVRYVCNLALNVNSWKNYCTRRHGTALLSNVNCDLMLFRLCNFELFYTKIINVNSSGSILRTKGSLSKQLTCATLLRCILKFQKS